MPCPGPRQVGQAVFTFPSGTKISSIRKFGFWRTNSNTFTFGYYGLANSPVAERVIKQNYYDVYLRYDIYGLTYLYKVDAIVDIGTSTTSVIASNTVLILKSQLPRLLIIGLIILIVFILFRIYKRFIRR